MCFYENDIFQNIFIFKEIKLPHIKRNKSRNKIVTAFVKKGNYHLGVNLVLLFCREFVMLFIFFEISKNKFLFVSKKKF